MTRSRTAVAAAVAALLILVGLLSLAWPGAAQAGVLERVSVAAAGAQSGGYSYAHYPAISVDGRYVVFFSAAADLVPGDTNADQDVFVRDRVAGTTERVSVATGGGQGSGWSGYPAISADGRYVVFNSSAPDLVAGDTNGENDIFVRDLVNDTTERVSVATGGAEGDGECTFASISTDGSFVAFVSAATDLVAGDTNGVTDIFVRDLVNDTTERASVASDESQAVDESTLPSISGDGRYVAFQSSATNLATGDTNSSADIFVRDRTGGTTARVSVNSSGTQGNSENLDPSISGDGRYVAFASWSTNLVTGDTNDTVDVFVRDRTGGTTTRVSVAPDGTQGDDNSGGGSLSADGRYVAFWSNSGTLVPDDTNGTQDCFLCDQQTGNLERVSVNAAGVEGDSASYTPSIGDDGPYIAFTSAATNLIAGDTNGRDDVFVSVPTPTVIDVDPAYGPTSGGTVVTIVGTNFSGIGGPATDPDAVTFGGVNAATYTVDSDHQITATAPAHATGTVQVQVTALGGSSADTTGDDYLYDVTYSSIRGSDRYDTAIRISKAMFPGALPAGAGLVLAPGETFPEALCGAPLAAAWGGPVLLTYQAALANNVKAELQRLAPARVFCIGMSTAVVNAVVAALPAATVTPINGSGAGANIIYDMSRKVANALAAKAGAAGKMPTATAIITVGTNFPDAIGVGPPACSQLWPIVLTNSGGGGALHTSAAGALTDLGITKAIKVGTYATLPGGVTGLANLSGADRYVTNANVANWAKANAGLTFAHTAFATGDKFPDALASGPYLAGDDGILLLSPLLGPVPAPIGAVVTASKAEVQHVTYIACIEPVISQVKALLGSVVNLVFIHHSVGENWLNDGLCAALNASQYHVADIYYGWPDDGVHPNYGDSTDTGDWPTWFTDTPSTIMDLVYAEMGAVTAPNALSPAPGENTIVMFKSCFPNSEVGSSITDEKAIYNSLLTYFQAHPDKMFVLITPPPMRSISYPSKTRELCNWLTDRNNGWLKNLTTGNVFVWDFYNVLTHPNAHHRLVGGVEVHEVVAGANTLYYPSGDDHPNTTGNVKATDEFVPLLNKWYQEFVASR